MQTTNYSIIIQLWRYENRVNHGANFEQKKFLQYKTKVKRLEKLIEENENQIQTYEVLLKHASSVYK